MCLNHCMYKMPLPVVTPDINNCRSLDKQPALRSTMIPELLFHADFTSGKKKPVIPNHLNNQWPLRHIQTSSALNDMDFLRLSNTSPVLLDKQHCWTTGKLSSEMSCWRKRSASGMSCMASCSGVWWFFGRRVYRSSAWPRNTEQ